MLNHNTCAPVIRLAEELKQIKEKIEGKEYESGGAFMCVRNKTMTNLQEQSVWLDNAGISIR